MNQYEVDNTLLANNKIQKKQLTTKIKIHHQCMQNILH